MNKEQAQSVEEAHRLTAVEELGLYALCLTGRGNVAVRPACARGPLLSSHTSCPATLVGYFLDLRSNASERSRSVRRGGGRCPPRAAEHAGCQHSAPLVRLLLFMSRLSLFTGLGNFLAYSWNPERFVFVCNLEGNGIKSGLKTALAATWPVRRARVRMRCRIHC